MPWPLIDERAKKIHAPVSRVVSVASGYAFHRVRIVQPFFAGTRAAADLHIDTILARGNYASMTNVAGKYVVKELVMA